MGNIDRPVCAETASGACPAVIYVKLLLTALFWGGTFVAGRIVSKNVGHFSIAFLRFLTASLLLLALTWRIEGRLPRLRMPQLVSIILLGLTGVFAYNAMFFKALQTIEASRAALIVASCPVFITIASAIFFRERISLLKALGIVISVVGAIVVVTRGRPREAIEGGVGWGEFFIFCCVLSWVAYSLIGKAAMEDLSPLVAVTCSSVVGTAALAVPALREGLIRNIPAHSATDWLCIVYLGIFGTVVGFVWYYQAIKRIGPVKAGLFINFVPIFGVLLSFLVLRETITLSLAIGAVLVVSGVYLTNRTSRVKAA
jgi:drug/metabolite transporter (DMT)-like permease